METIWTFVKENYEILFGALGTIYGVFQLLYCTNEKVYLFFKKLLLTFQKTKSVTLKSDFSLTSERDPEEVKQILLEKFKIRHGHIIETGPEHGFMSFDLNISISPYNQTKILITAKKETTIEFLPRDIETIRRMLKAIEKTTQSNITNVDIDVYFPKGNPYEGFFIKRLPFENVQDFIVKIRYDESLIEAKKKKIIIRSKFLENALHQLDSIVTLRTPLLQK